MLANILLSSIITIWFPFSQEKSASPWKEKYKNDDGIELMLPAQFEHLLPDIIYTLIHVTDIKAEYVFKTLACLISLCKINV